MSSDTARTAPPARDGDDAGAPPATSAVTAGAHGDGATVGLPARERDMLAFERQWWRFPGAKETAIRERFGISPTRYYQVLNALVDRPEALAADPLLVRRLRRMRAARQRQRSGRVLGSDPSRG
ncbi:DUF3263 domain-containing protein [Modestobacter versicolor]|uniref:DUF3263 domain-containing protein n=1 Tax=Modestobacter versicolor TaxID=429133 RepID=UPI0034DFC2F2